MLDLLNKHLYSISLLGIVCKVSSNISLETTTERLRCWLMRMHEKSRAGVVMVPLHAGQLGNETVCVCLPNQTCT